MAFGHWGFKSLLAHVKKLKIEFCDAGRLLVKPSDPYWSRPCMLRAQITLLIAEEDKSTLERKFCPDHMDDLHRMGVV